MGYSYHLRPEREGMCGGKLRDESFSGVGLGGGSGGGHDG